MKRPFISSFLVASILALALLACQTNETPLPQPASSATQALAVKKGWLVFSSVEAYRRAVDNPSEEAQARVIGEVEGLKGFTSLAESAQRRARTGAEAPTDGDLIKSDYFRRLLNDQHLIQIGPHLIRINPRTKKVYMLPAALESQVADLLAEKTSNPNIRQFSTNDDVLALLNSDIGVAHAPCTTVIPVGDISIVSGEQLITVGSDKRSFETEAYFERNGIFTQFYGKLTSRKESVPGSPSTTWPLSPVPMRLNYTGNYRFPCPSPPATSIAGSKISFNPFLVAVLTQTFYMGTAPLHHYKVNLTPKYPHPGANLLTGTVGNSNY